MHIEQENAILEAIKSNNPAVAKPLVNKNVSTYIFLEMLDAISRNGEIIESKNLNGEIDRTYAKDWLELIEAIILELNFRARTGETHPLWDAIEGQQNETLLDTIFSSPNFNLNGPVYEIDFDFNPGTGRYETVSPKVINATKKNQLQVLKSLRKINADFNFEDRYGSKALHYVKSVEAAEIILRDSNINHVNKAGYSPLFSAVCRRANWDLIKFFITNGSSLCCDSQNILHALSSIDLFNGRSLTETEDLILANKICQEISNANGNIEEFLKKPNRELRTPLENALFYENFSMFKILLEKERQEGIYSLADGRILSEIITTRGLKYLAINLISYILYQEKNSKKPISREILSEIAEELRSSPNLYLKETCLSLLDEAVKNFGKTPDVNNIFASPTNADQAKTMSSKNDNSKIFIIKWFNFFITWANSIFDRMTNIFTGKFLKKSENKDNSNQQQDSVKINNPGASPLPQILENSNNRA